MHCNNNMKFIQLWYYMITKEIHLSIGLECNTIQPNQCGNKKQLSTSIQIDLQSFWKLQSIQSTVNVAAVVQCSDKYHSIY